MNTGALQNGPARSGRNTGRWSIGECVGDDLEPKDFRRFRTIVQLAREPEHVAQR